MSKLISVKTMKSRTGFRCYSMGPTPVNPKKEFIKDYDSRSIIFKNKADAIRVATAMLSLADTEEMDDARVNMHITALATKRNEDGYSVTVNLCISDAMDDE